MSRFTLAIKKAASTSKGTIATAVADINDIVLNNSTYRDGSVTDALIGFESVAEASLNAFSTTLESLKNDLGRTTLPEILRKRVSTLSPVEQEEQIELGIESAAITLLLASADREDQLLQAVVANPFVPNAKAINVYAMDGGDTPSINFESFEPQSFQNFAAVTAIINAQNAIAGGFQRVWFPQEMIPIGDNGKDVRITIPQITSNQVRASAGGAYTLTKQSVIPAIVDPSILESEATTIVPVVVDATTPACLVTAAVIPTYNKTVLGLSVPTRPLLFGQDGVDLISLSNYAGLVTAGALNETDALDPIMGIGAIYVQMTLTTGVGGGSPVANTVVFRQDLTNQAGWLLSQVNQGSIQELQTTMKAKVTVSSNTAAANIFAGNYTTFSTALKSVLGVSNQFALVFDTALSARANTEYATFPCYKNKDTTLFDVFDDNNASIATAAMAALNNSTTSFTATAVGWDPSARRTNANLRSMGTILDANTTKLYRFAVNMQPPLCIHTPVNTNATISFDMMAEMAHYKNNGRCVTALKNMENWLIDAGNIPNGANIMGMEYVLPRYAVQNLDVTQYVSGINSMDNFANLRGQMLAALRVMANYLLISSNYLAAIQFSTGDMNAYEVIMVGDPQLTTFLWESGDTRTMGDNTKFTITSDLNIFFKGKIYLSAKRSGGSEEIHPLDFGRSLVAPSITYTVQMNRAGEIHKEIQMVPRFNAYAVLPILGRLNVTGLDQLYARWSIPSVVSI